MRSRIYLIFLIGLGVFIVGTTFITSKPKPSLLFDIDSKSSSKDSFGEISMQLVKSENEIVQVILYPEQDIYSIGEPIRPKLQVKNNGQAPIEIYGFVFGWDKLTFNLPNAAHLIGPDNQDNLVVYQQSAETIENSPFIQIEAGGDKWYYLPIYHHLHLRKLGKYTFWIELADNLGQVHRSNEISFQLVDVPSSIPSQLVELNLQTLHPSFASMERIEFDATITNKSDKKLTFLKPQQDSFDGWVNPVYQFTVISDDGRSLALALRDGNMDVPTYNATTQFTIAPRGTYRQKLQLPVFPEMQNPGTYQVRLTYLVRQEAIGKAGTILDRQMNWAKEVFIGRLESNEISITIK